MQTPYQPLAAPQPVYAVAVPAASAAANAACCPCCVEPACCSRVGSCPCFCTGYTASFSIALSMMWLALPMFATALAIDLFDVMGDYGQLGLYIGMWSYCGGFDDDGDEYNYECDNYGSGDLGNFGNDATFNAMRSLAVIGTAFTLIAGILGAIRLARQQRNKPNSTNLNSMTAVSGWLALASSAVAFGLTFPLNDSLNENFQNNSDGFMSTSFGGGWVMLIVGMSMLAVGVLMHTITQCCYSRTVAADEQDEPGMYGAAYPAAPSVFSHPQPLTHSVPAPSVYYPTASAVHYPPPQYVQPPMGHIYQ